MKSCIILIIAIAASCGSIETKKPIFFLDPKSIKLGGSLSDISRELRMDTTEYRTILPYWHIKGVYVRFPMKKFTLSQRELGRLSLKDNLYDSVHLTFYKDFLYSASFYLSNNQKIEILKFGLNPSNRFMSGDVTFRGTKLYALDSSLYAGRYRELSYSYTRKKISFFYSEDIVENVAVLNIDNLKMRRLFR